MQRNILYISNEAALGGAAQSLINMIKVLKARTIKPIVIIPGNGIIEERLQELEVKYYVVPFSMGYGAIGAGTSEKDDANFVDNFRAALKLQDIIKQEQIDLIHINSSVSNVGAFAALMAGIPYVWHFREFLEEDFECEFWDKELKKQLIDYADSVVTISNAVAASYKEKYGINSICIYNGLDTELYRNDLVDVSCDDKFHSFIITGAISKNKGQYDAVRAVELLLQEGIENIHLTLVGHGPARFRWFLNQYVIKKNLKEFVTILPFQKNLTEYRKQCQYALTTSKMEALGRCTIEAMLAGNIVIGADTGGTKEIIGEDETRGYLYSQGDYVNLATVMKRVIAETPAKKQMCRINAQRYAEETFSPERYADEIFSVYENVFQNYAVRKKTDVEVLLNGLNSRYGALKNTLVTNLLSENNYKNILEKWNKLEEKGLTIGDYLKHHNCNKITIYGMGNLGCRLYEEVIAEGIEIPYVIDRNPEFIKELVDVKMPEEEFAAVDLIIISVSKEEDELVKYYRANSQTAVTGLFELIENVLKRDFV